jgi:chemotaxis protein histidine kinase CheA
VVKSLLDNFDAVRGISGATILGDGRVALILDLDSLCSLPQRPADADGACDLPSAAEMSGEEGSAPEIPGRPPIPMPASVTQQVQAPA